MKYLKKILALALVALSIMAVALPALADTGWTTADNVNMRNSSTGTVVVRIPSKGTPFDYNMGTDNCVVVVNNTRYSGTIDPSYQTFYRPSYATGPNGSLQGNGFTGFDYVKLTSDVNIRTGPGLSYSSYGLFTGTKGQVMGKTTVGDFQNWIWYYVTFDNSISGWVRGDCLVRQ